MKKNILSQLMILSFAFAGLFLVGNNVFGGNDTIIILLPPIEIECDKDPGWGAQCWKYSEHAPGHCVWSGNTEDKCWP